jgi:hypothetical protein
MVQMWPEKGQLAKCMHVTADRAGVRSSKLSSVMLVCNHATASTSLLLLLLLLLSDCSAKVFAHLRLCGFVPSWSASAVAVWKYRLQKQHMHHPGVTSSVTQSGKSDKVSIGNPCAVQRPLHSILLPLSSVATHACC